MSEPAAGVSVSVRDRAPPRPAPGHAGTLSRAMARRPAAGRGLGLPVWIAGLVATLMRGAFQRSGSLAPAAGAVLSSVAPVAGLVAMAFLLPAPQESVILGGLMMGLAFATAIGLVPVRRHLENTFSGSPGAGLQRSLVQVQGFAMLLGGFEWLAVHARQQGLLVADELAPSLSMGLLWGVHLAGHLIVMPMLLARGCREVVRIRAPASGETTPRLMRWRMALLERGLMLRPTAAGFSMEGFCDGILVQGQIDLSRAPAPGVLWLTLPVTAAAHPRMTLAARELDEPPGIPLSDPILARLVRLRGVPNAQANALVDELHEEILDVVRGFPGAEITRGRLQMAVGLLPGLEEEGPDLDDALDRCIRLAAAMEARVGGIADGG
ncbi:MAG: hypothetical protein VX265_02860 [Myxococcota bacterium]|nr:hypothetical protein [Myxococcota bacterium]